MSRLTVILALGVLMGCPDDADPPATDVAVTDDISVQDDTGAVPDTSQPPTEPVLSEPPALPLLPDLCQGAPAPEKMQWDMAADKVSISVFHFNIQYVAGGLDNYFGVWTATEEEIEDLIIVESFEPLVDLFERHPDWGAGLELQGLMLEIMAERHPDILARLQVLAARGQVDVMSYHWSDQLVTAYRRADMDWSWAENERVFQSLCMPRAPVHFLQEGQFGPGIAAFAAEKGETLVLPRNLLKLFHQPAPAGHVFENLGSRVLVTNGYSGDGLELNWNYADDGELAATGDANPYLLSEFVHDPESVAKYEAKLQGLADNGYVIAPISHYLTILDDREIAPTVIDPPVLDGSWQPDDTGNMHLWMGGKGQVPGDERDNAVLVANMMTSRRLVEIEQRLGEAEAAGIDTQKARALFRHAVRELLLAEVSDSTGWRPLGTEVEYSVRHEGAARKAGDELDAWLVFHGLEAPVKHTPQAPSMAAAPEGLEAVKLVTQRDATLDWREHEEYFELVIDLAAGDAVTEASESPPAVRLEIPMFHDKIVYPPALMDTELVTAPLSAYAFAQDGRVMGLPLANGLLALGPEWTLVLDQRTIHLAAIITAGQVAFEDLTQPLHEAAQWRLRFYNQAAADVLKLVASP